MQKLVISYVDDYELHIPVEIVDDTHPFSSEALGQW